MTHEAAVALAHAQRDDLERTLNRRWYPTFHLAAPAGWINDPNGLCFFAGRYHAFYQHFPGAPAWGPMHWGHASSADLVTWRHEPIALAPEPDSPDADGCWSGSAIETPDGSLALFYTGHRWRNGVDGTAGNVQRQCQAVARDGAHFTKTGVVIEPEPWQHEFRDPKVWRWHDRWWMTVGAQSLEGRGQVWLYSSDDLQEWSFDCVLYDDPDEDVFMLECPDFFALGEYWVLLYGPMTHARPSGYAGRNGHNMGYRVGRWTPGQPFEALTEYRVADWGRHFYAGQSLLTDDGRRLVFGWMGEFVAPTASQGDGWAGQFAIPREVSLGDDLTLRWTPLAELDAVAGPAEASGAFELAADTDRLVATEADALELRLTVDLTASTAEQVALCFEADGHPYAAVVYDDLARRVVIDRGLRGNLGRGVRSAPVTAGTELTLRVLVDGGSLEVFVGDGTETVSSLVFAPGGLRSITLAAVSGRVAVRALTVRRLGTIWA